MRVILAIIAIALALPALAGNSPAEITLPDAPEELLESAQRTATADDAILAPAEEIADGPVAKEHNNQVDEPDGPPCGEGG